MKSSLTNVLLALVVAAIGVFSGLLLVMYSGADDAPGGVLLGTLIMVGAAVVGVRMAQRDSIGSPSRGSVEERYRALEAELEGTHAQLDELQRQVLQIEEKLAFTQSLLESRGRAGPVLPPRA